MTVAAPVLVDDRHVRAGAYVLSIESRLYAVVDRRVNYAHGQGKGRAEALVEDVATPTPEQRYLSRMDVIRHPWKYRRAVTLPNGALIDGDADTTTAWIPVAELVGWELVRAPEGMGVTSFPKP